PNPPASAAAGRLAVRATPPVLPPGSRYSTSATRSRRSCDRYLLRRVKRRRRRVVVSYHQAIDAIYSQPDEVVTGRHPQPDERERGRRLLTRLDADFLIAEEERHALLQQDLRAALHCHSNVTLGIPLYWAGDLIDAGCHGNRDCVGLASTSLVGSPEAH